MLSRESCGHIEPKVGINMTRMLRNISIHAAMIIVLACFVVAITSVATMGVISERHANEALVELNRVSAEQTSEVARADALLNRSRNDVALAEHYILREEMGRADGYLESVDDGLERADARFKNFANSSKTEEAEVLASALEADFQTVLQLVRQQHSALLQRDSDTFDQLVGELRAPASSLDESMEALIGHTFDSSDALVDGYRKEAHRFQLLGLALLVVVGLLIAFIYKGLRAMMIRPLGEAVEWIQSIAKADLSNEVPERGRNEIGQLFTAMGEMRLSLTKIVGQVRNSSNSIHVGSREIAVGNADLSSRTEEQAAALEETASSMDQLTATVKQNADNASQANGLAGDASTTAERGGEVVDRVIKTMYGISDSSNKIANITEVIDSIAFQTNILALNASVEAARAGEQGRGFAVVASEVRNLATRSAEAAKEIKTLIESSVA
ncbi:methyl-accepting chemotaxis sensory transducer with TarH sensor [Billgrantia gudaonensis]|uniref:Methyl-accepting chemotaxis sensory transducer with TarH sensor n=1 Tax=Billgrantia gudaonensis TaxID=376427 RepID=A0A1G8ZSH5_9GAMM|nr:methyl-accepting chemotaxis sensory transducer with TarH sensor [Halomonas gudaonensis]